MRNKRNAPRQPLSQSRPKVVSKKVVLPPKKPKISRGAPAVAKSKRTTAIAAAPAKKSSRGLASRRAPAAQRAPEIFARLRARYPDAHCALDFQTPFQLLMATILSAQCTDKRVNMVTPALFRRYPDAQSLADANQEELEDIIRSTGFFHNKARALIALGKALVERHGGQVPGTMAQLVQLPGVGRKTANVVLGNAFRRNEGVVVDTHVG